MTDIYRTKPRKTGIDIAKQCAESMQYMRITQTMRDTGEYQCPKCGRKFRLGAGERVNPEAYRRMPRHLPKKAQGAQ